MTEIIIAAAIQLAIQYADGPGWMALNTYFEARGESMEGKIAVNQIVLQRMIDRNMSAKDVINERHQFEWLWDDKRDMVNDWDTFIECSAAVEIAKQRRMLGDNFHKANLYYSVDIPAPWWVNSPKVKFIMQIDKHRFYREPWNGKAWTFAKVD